MDLAKFDLSNVSPEVMEVRSPTGDILMQADGIHSVTITLLPADSEPMIKARNASLNLAAKRQKNTAESVQADAIRLLAKASVAWSGIGIGEDETEFSTENAIRLYTLYPFIREQVDTFVTERGNFIKS